MTKRPARIVVAIAMTSICTACQDPQVSYQQSPQITLDAAGKRPSIDPSLAVNMAKAGSTFTTVGRGRLALDLDTKWPADGAASPINITPSLIDSDVGLFVTPKSQLFQSGWFSTTTTALTIQTQAGGYVPAQISISVTDNTQSTLTALSSLITAAMTVAAIVPGVHAAPAPPAPVLPTFNPANIDLPSDTTTIPSAPTPVPGNPNWTYVLVLDEPTAASAEKFSDFLITTSLNDFVAYYPVPACRNVKITLTDPGGKTYPLKATTGAPDWLELIPIPANGKITAGANCSASVTPGAVNPAQTMIDIAALGTTVASLMNGNKTTTTATTKPTTPTPATK
jgi:hypothetical protein